MSDLSHYQEFLNSFHSDKFIILRPAQETVLHKFSEHFKYTEDVAVELPTGAGKTLIALLISEERRRENQKVAILSANKTLAQQMLQESQELGIPAVLMEGSGQFISNRDRRRYHRAQSIAIMNYWVYFNQNPVIDPADLLIMDDAHLAEHCLHSLYSFEITRFQHGPLFESLVSELHDRFPEYSVLSAALEGNSEWNQPPELLSFIDQTLVHDRIQEIVDASPLLQSDIDLRFRWARIRDKINEANIYLARDSLWIRPYIYPLIANPHYKDARQRIHMSATVGDPGDLGRRLGVRNITKIAIDKEYSDATYGRRLLVMDRTVGDDFSDRLESVLLTALQIHPKSVWLCSSTADAIKYQSQVTQWLKCNGLQVDPTWLLTPEGDEIDVFKESEKGHLFVGGRFDGMDFNGDECRLVILTTLPRAIDTQEEFISAYLRDSEFMRQRLNQRVVQALGRCNRDDGDYAVYVLADRRFSSHFGLDSNKQGLPTNIVAEMDMGQDLAELDTARLREVVRNFLGGDFSSYDEEIDTYIADVPLQEPQALQADTSADEVLGWTAMFDSKNHTIAEEKFETCWESAIENNVIEMGALHRWHQAKALYLQSLLNDDSARQRALLTLESAINRGGRSAWFNRMRASLNRGRSSLEVSNEAYEDDYLIVLVRSFDELLEICGITGSRYERYCNRMERLLLSNSHNEFLEGLEALGKLLGYASTRPRNTGATDCRWRGIFGSWREIITFEAKIEDSPSNRIILADIGQAHNQMNAAESQFANQGFGVKGTIVTHLTDFDAGAEMSIGDIKVVTKQAVQDLWRHVRTILSAYRRAWDPVNITVRRQAAESIVIKVPNTGWLLRALASDSNFVSSQELLREWQP